MRILKTKTDVKQVFAGDEVYLRNLFLIVWERKFYPIAFAVFFVVIGLIAQVTQKDTYLSTSTMLSEKAAAPQNAVNSRTFSRMFGFDPTRGEGQVTDFENPMMYNSILGSKPFLLELSEERFYFPMYEDTLTLQEFFILYDDRNLISKLPGNIVSFIKSPLSFASSKEKDSVVKEVTMIETPDQNSDSSIVTYLDRRIAGVLGKISQNITVSVDGSFITVTTMMPTALLSAQFNEVVFKKLIEFATARQTAKERRDVEFVTIRAETAKNRFVEKQREYAAHRDKNRGVISQLAQIEEQQIKYEYDLLFNIYNNVTIQLENKKLNLEENTPLYTVFEPVYIPNEPIGVSNSTLIIYFVIGLFLGLFVIVIDIVRLLMKNDG
jgi:hypothetical protein